MAGYLGRFQVGQVVPIAIATVNGGVPVAPDQAPVATVTDSFGSVVATLRLAMQGDSLHFGLPYFLGASTVLGTYSIAYSYSISGAPGTASGSFDVIQGGDPGGAVISLYAYQRPEAQYVVAQLSGGVLVQGSNPSL